MGLLVSEQTLLLIFFVFLNLVEYLCRSFKIQNGWQIMCTCCKVTSNIRFGTFCEQDSSERNVVFDFIPVLLTAWQNALRTPQILTSVWIWLWIHNNLLGRFCVCVQDEIHFLKSCISDCSCFCTGVVLSGTIIVNIGNNLHILLLQPAYEYDTFQLLSPTSLCFQQEQLSLRQTVCMI